ncbi:ImmA/IrrE family metallo-endopeptidase [Pseudoduganella sp. SL102]|uniref:ImmA/IrrE family metallo-endopeptidase n=1 Tax=Pseudoduganella sp. SL102 TaxID=2995154 RepID=UPI00248AA474|nr:ImmA/IrrE family metallo-endopeptidase [Pseudoduganella sp. SL102]WBS02025.1 ImmA/IrrE family metallo-endopeptidase [Pseudoduganella sp. SL102]
MLIELTSRLDPRRPYLSANIKDDGNHGFAVSGFTSPIEKVRSYYDGILKGNFDYSHVSMHGQQLFYGTNDHQARNLLLALAQEAARYGRTPKFSPASITLQDWFAGSSLAESLLNSVTQTIAQLAIVLSEDIEGTSDFAAWFYYCIQTSLASGAIDMSATGRLLLAIISDETDFSANLLAAFSRLDPTFIGLWAHEGSYQVLRRRALSQKSALKLLNSFSPQIDIRASRPSRTSEKLSIAARGAKRDSISTNPAIWETIEKAVQGVGANPAPTYLPTPGSPQKVAYDLLKYFNHNLPALEEVALILGTQVVTADLPEEILGLYVTNTEAHHSAILVNRKTRNEGAHRFTICHELGHYLLHSDKAFLCGYKEIYEHAQVTEADANSFAAELLMPTGEIRPMLGKPFNSSTILSVMRRFNCSMEAAARRFIDLADQRKLGLIAVLNGRVASVAGSKINDAGLRWIGKPSVGTEAVNPIEAIKLSQDNERRLIKFFASAEANWLQDLDINIHPFTNDDGYYVFIEKSA